MNVLLRRTPAHEFDVLRREMDRLFDDVFTGRAARDGETVWSPPVDLVEVDDAFLIALDLPGVDASQIEVTLDDGVLRVSGTREAPARSGEGRLIHAERRHGRFFRSVTLGSGLDPDGIEADCADGVLTIRVAKAETVKPRRIEVQRSGRSRVALAEHAEETEEAEA